MPSIIQYQQRTTPQASYATPRATPLNTQSGDVFGQVADALSGMLANQAKREDEAGRAWAIDAVSQARLEWTGRLQESQANAPAGASEFTKNFITEFDEYSAEALKNAPSASAKKYFHERLADIRTSLGEKAITFEAGARVDYRDNQFNKAISNNQSLMMSDPGQFDVALAETLSVIRESALPPKQRADMEQKAVSNIATAAVWSQMNKSPTAFMQSIGMTGGASPGAGVIDGRTGNKAFDLLSFDDRVKMVGQAMSIKNRMDSDAERAADKLRKDKGDEIMKEALSRLDPQPGSPRLDRDFIEEARKWVSPAEYKSLLQMSKSGVDGGGAPRSDPGTYRHLQGLLRNDPEQAQKEAFTAHANGLISNSDLSSITQRASSLDRQGGPKTAYERTRLFVSGSLDPGPMVQDPVGRSRLAAALNEFDSWAEAGKRSDAEIEARGKELIRQWQFINLRDTAAGLPQPRYGSVPRGGDPALQIKAIADSWALTKKAMRDGKITKEEANEEASRLNDWRKIIKRANEVTR